jgi:hypothetical protein
VSYDIKCDELARHFLPSQTSEQLVARLAQVIQDRIEEWLEETVLQRERETPQP